MAISSVGPAGGVPGAGGVEVFRWNKADVTQFDTSNVYLDGGTLSAPTLTTDTTGEMSGGKRLIHSMTGNGEGCSIFLANDPLPSLDLLFELEQSDCDLGGAGIVFAADYPGGNIQTQLYCAAYACVGAGNRQFAIEAGVQTTQQTAGPGIIQLNGRGMCYLRVKADRDGSGLPRGTVYASGPSTAAVHHIALDSWPDQPFAAGWSGKTALRWGLVLWAQTGGVGGPARWGDIRIYDMSGA